MKKNNIFTILFSVYICVAFLYILVEASISFATTTQIMPITPEQSKELGLTESNGIAAYLCLFVSNAMLSDVGKVIFLLTLLPAGTAALQGKLDLRWLFLHVLGVAIFFGLPGIFSIFLPNLDLSMGCKCKEYLPVAYDPTNDVIFLGSTLLNTDCTPK